MAERIAGRNLGTFFGVLRRQRLVWSLVWPGGRAGDRDGCCASRPPLPFVPPVVMMARPSPTRRAGRKARA